MNFLIWRCIFFFFFCFFYRQSLGRFICFNRVIFIFWSLFIFFIIWDKYQLCSFYCEVGKLFFLWIIMDFTKVFLKQLLEIHHQSFSFSFVVLLQILLIQSWSVFFLGIFRSVVVINKRQILCVHINKKLQDKSILFIPFRGKSNISQKNINFNLKFDESLDDTIDIKFKLEEKSFIFFFSKISFHIFADLCNKVK